MARETISACLIVQDEQARLPEALQSIAFCDEIVVVDGGSRDGTIALARAAGATVIESPWPGFAAQRNVALDAATSDWVLEIDADERVTPQLRASIEELLRSEPRAVKDMAIFALRNRFLGGLLGPSAKYPSYRSRLFRRGCYRHDEQRAVHEGLDVRERPLVLAGDLEHELADSLSEALRDMLAYARLESAHVVRPGSALAYVKGMLLRPLAKFAYRTVVDGGWRDGWRGLLKISLDVSSDVLVWLAVLRGAGATEAAEGMDAEHFGRRRVGQMKVVALASSARSARSAAEQLERLERQGIDVTLLARRPPDGLRVPFQRLRGLSAIALVRSLEAEEHVRRIDAVLAADGRARLALRALPGSLRPPLADAEQLAQSES